MDFRIERIRKGEFEIHEWDAVRSSIGRQRIIRLQHFPSGDDQLPPPPVQMNWEINVLPGSISFRVCETMTILPDERVRDFLERLEQRFRAGLG